MGYPLQLSLKLQLAYASTQVKIYRKLENMVKERKLSDVAFLEIQLNFNEVGSEIGPVRLRLAYARGKFCGVWIK